MPRTLTGKEAKRALDEIHRILDGHEWNGADDLDAIAEVLIRFGYTIRPPRPVCEECGEVFDGNETTCESECHCPDCAGTGECAGCDDTSSRSYRLTPDVAVTP